MMCRIVWVMGELSLTSSWNQDHPYHLATQHLIVASTSEFKTLWHFNVLATCCFNFDGNIVEVNSWSILSKTLSLDSVVLIFEVHPGKRGLTKCFFRCTLLHQPSVWKGAVIITHCETCMIFWTGWITSPKRPLHFLLLFYTYVLQSIHI